MPGILFEGLWLIAIEVREGGVIRPPRNDSTVRDLCFY